MSRVLFLVTLAILASTTPAAAEQFVVVPAKTKLYPAPAIGGDAITLPNPHTTLKKLAEKDGWVRIEANGPSKGICTSSAWQLGELTLQMWVPASKLSEVTTKRVTTSHDDGTKITVAAGVPLAQASGQRFAMLGNLRWPLTPQSAEIGKSFEPAPLASANGKWMHAEGDLRLGGEPIAKTDGQSFRVTNEIQADGHTRHRIVRHCLSAIVAGKLKAPDDSLGVGGLLGSLIGGGGGEQWKIAANSAVFWPDGKRAGHFRTTGWIAVKDTTKRKSRLCGKFGNDDDIEVCFDEADAEKHVSDTVSSLFGAGGLGTAGISATEEQPKGLSQRVIRRTIRQREPALRKCYAQAERPQREDQVELKFTVLETGHVADVVVDSSSLDRPARDCMVRVANGLIFAAKKGREPVKVSHPVELRVKR